MNGWRRWRLEFILHNRHHTPAFESLVMKILVHGPYISYQDRACRDWFSHFTASQPFQSLFTSIMNGLTWLRLVYGHRNGHHNLFSSSERVQIWLGPCLLFEPRLCGCWLIQAIHSIPTLPMYNYAYNEWLEKVETGTHPPQPVTTPRLLSQGWSTFHTKIEPAETDSAISQHLNPSNLSSQV